MSSTHRSIIDATTATTTSSATPTFTDIITEGMHDTINNSKPSQLYVYPSVAVIIFLLAGIHICRFFDSQRMARRRMQERQAHEEAALDRWRQAAGLGIVRGDFYTPRMFSAVLRNPQDDHRRLGSDDWGDLLPISANIKKPPKPPPPIPSSASSALLPSSSTSTLRKIGTGTKRTVSALGNSFNSIVRRRPPSPPADALPPCAPSSDPEATRPSQPEYVYRPQTLVTGILIAMPDARRPFYRTLSSPSSSSPSSSKHSLQPPSINSSSGPPPFIVEEELPEVALGYAETDWSRYGKPGDDDSDFEEPNEVKSSVIRASLEGALFDRPW